MKIRNILAKNRILFVKKWVDKRIKTCYYKSEPRKTEKQRLPSAETLLSFGKPGKKKQPGQQDRKTVPQSQGNLLNRERGGTIVQHRSDTNGILLCPGQCFKIKEKLLPGKCAALRK